VFRYEARFLPCLAAALAALLCLVGCGESQPPPVYAATNNYLNALAAGNYASACAVLDGRARASLTKLAGSRVSCARAFTLCLPNRAENLKQDQAQLYYATTDIHTHGSTASATTSGTAVANALKRLTLAKEGGHWKVTSYGQGLKRCRRRGARHARTTRGDK